MEYRERTVILGASRGLGAQVAFLAGEVGSVLAVSRKIAGSQYAPHVHTLQADFNISADQDRVLAKINEFNPSRVIYTAGGGPYGPFLEKDWKSHEWAFNVTFLFAARVAHSVFSQNPQAQVILVGSSIAEDEADPSAASYSAAKHALKGLYKTIRRESPALDIRLISPGYMDTGLIPPHVSIRKRALWPPRQVAEELWNWAHTADVGGHKVYPHYPS